jgi:hypothetical protein
MFAVGNLVTLPPVPTQLYSTEAEPQMMIERSNNFGYVYAESTDPYNQDSPAFNPASMVVSNQTTRLDAPGQLAVNVRRISVNQIGLNWVSPNILAGWNNEILLEFAGGESALAVIPEGSYTTETDLQAAIAVAVSNATVGNVDGPYTVSFTAVTDHPGSYLMKLTSQAPAAVAFRISASCLATTNGYYLYGFEVGGDIDDAGKYLSPQYYYTRYVDFVSRRLTQHSRLPSQSTHNNSGIIARAYLASYTQGVVGAPFPFYVNDVTPTGINWNYNDPISTFDITVQDEFGNTLRTGNPLQHSVGAGLPGNGFTWTLNLRLEF